MDNFDELNKRVEKEISETVFTTQNILLAEIIRRIASTAKLEDETIRKMQMRKDRAELERIGYLTLNGLPYQLDAVINKSAREIASFSHRQDRRLFERRRIEFLPYENNKLLQRLTVQAANEAKQAVREIMNTPAPIKPLPLVQPTPERPEPIEPPRPTITEPTPQQARRFARSTAVGLIDPQGRRYTIPDYYQKSIDKAVQNVQSGTKTYDQAIKEAVQNISQSGCRVVRFEGDERRPVNRTIEAVIRLNVMTAIANLAGQVSIANIIKLKAIHVIVSSHSGARTGQHGGGWGDVTDHSNWQGHVFKLSDKFFELFGGK